MKHLPIILLPVAAVLAAVLVFTNGSSDVARADPGPVVAGHDLFRTEEAVLDFANVPLPADLFGPGSDPFDGSVDFEGVPIGSFDGFGPLGKTDTIVERLEDAQTTFPDFVGDTIDIEIVALELRSVAPITVSFNGGASFEDWDLTARVVEGDVEQTTGSMTIRHEYPNGGTFDTGLLSINALVTFTKVGGGGVLGGYLGDLGLPIFELEATDSPWCHDPVPDLLDLPGLTGPNFYPGSNCAGPGAPTTEPVEEEHLPPWDPSRHKALPVLAPSIGGTTELLVGGSDASASAGDGSGGSFTYVAVAAAGALVLAAGGGWYARRRWIA